MVAACAHYRRRPSASDAAPAAKAIKGSAGECAVCGTLSGDYGFSPAWRWAAA